MVNAVVVEDSHFMRVQIAEILEAGGITVVDEARNGTGAVETVREVEPDVVTMDVKMPGMDGIEAVERIMATAPTPILMLSRYTEDGADTTFEALEAGAVDFFPKPGGEVSTTLVQYADDLVERVRTVADADVAGTTATGTSGTGAAASTAGVGTADLPAGTSPGTTPTIAIAASTGGPPEVQSILGALPADLDCRVLVVQHMPGNFTDRFAQRLDAFSDLSVREAGPNETVGPGEAVVARGGSHLEVRGETGARLDLALTDDPPVHSIRPSADVTFDSLADCDLDPLFGVVLTGMGSDGAAGIERIAEVGGTTIAQDPDTASISAMPERAIETGAVETVLPTRDVPEAIVDSLDLGSATNG